MSNGVGLLDQPEVARGQMCPVGAPARVAAGSDREERLVARRRELERAMRAHPAGRSLPAGATSSMPGRRGSAVRVRGAVPAPGLRLTLRGWVVMGVLVVALAVGLGALAGGVLGQGGGGGLHLAGESRVVVHSGDTLWSIASNVAGDDDVRAVVDRIQRANGLHGTAISPGQVLRLP